MHEYEIRVLREDGKASLIYSVLYFNDAAAIAAGSGIAGGKGFEVWRGMDRIYMARPGRPYLVASTDRPQAGAASSGH